MATVAIASPHGGLVGPDWLRSIQAMQVVVPQHQFTHIDVDFQIVGKARNMCVEAAIANNLDLVWFIDDDIIVPEGAGVLIDQAMTLGVVSAVYYNRRTPNLPQIYESAAVDGFPGKFWPRIEWPDKGLFKADAVGAGCLLVRTAVFQRMQKALAPVLEKAVDQNTIPWVKTVVRELSPWFEFLDKKGEDMYFCERCADIGQDIWVNAEIECLHMGRVPVDGTQFRYLKENNLIHREAPV